MADGLNSLRIQLSSKSRFSLTSSIISMCEIIQQKNSEQKLITTISSGQIKITINQNRQKSQ